jgi:hypothetical protein
MLAILIPVMMRARVQPLRVAVAVVAQPARMSLLAKLSTRMA